MKDRLHEIKSVGEGPSGPSSGQPIIRKLLRALSRTAGIEQAPVRPEGRRPGASVYDTYYSHHEISESAITAERCRAMGLLAYQRGNVPR